jgi:glycosyltransferase involved in cell wall biosynthesis
MIDGLSIAVVVPAKNEERLIARVLETLPPLVDAAVVIDDGSEDATLARAAAARCSARVQLVRHPVSLGVGGAIVRGYREALALGADVVAVMAGDAQMDPRDLAALVAPIARREADYVKGDRLRHPEARRMPWSRRLGSAALAVLTSRAVGLRVHDSQCGFTAASRSALEAIDLAAVWPGYGYPNDLIARFARAGMRIHEVPVRPVYGEETSGLRPWHVVRIGLIIGRAWLARPAAPPAG